MINTLAREAVEQGSTEHWRQPPPEARPTKRQAMQAPEGSSAGEKKGLLGRAGSLSSPRLAASRTPSRSLSHALDAAVPTAVGGSQGQPAAEAAAAVARSSDGPPAGGSASPGQQGAAPQRPVGQRDPLCPPLQDDSKLPMAVSDIVQAGQVGRANSACVLSYQHQCTCQYVVTQV